MSTPAAFLCSSCGKEHPGPSMVYGPDAPVYWYALSSEERDERFKLDSDLGVLDGEHYFIRGRLEIPVVGSSECFAWLVWATLSSENFARVIDHWEADGRESEPPYFGWLSTRLPGYPDTVNLKVHVHTRPVGVRPFIELEATEHPLAIEQREGITMDRIREIATQVIHPGAE